MQAYMSAVWRCRYFWFSLVKMDLRTRYRRSVLGIGWSLLHPIAMTVVLCTVFATLFNQDIRTYGPFVLTGISFWGFVSGVTLQGAQCLRNGEAYIRQYPAPMAIYPLRVVLGAGFHFLIALVVVLLLAWAFHGFGNLPALAALVPAMLLLAVLGWSLAVLSGFANVYFPDTQHLLEVGLQILFYATPIVWTPAMLRQRGLGWVVDYNPIASCLETVRAPILRGEMPSMQASLITAASVTLATCAAVFVLRKLQGKVIFHL